jgi:hypothetical protein
MDFPKRTKKIDEGPDFVPPRYRRLIDQMVQSSILQPMTCSWKLTMQKARSSRRTRAMRHQSGEFRARLLLQDADMVGIRQELHGS